MGCLRWIGFKEVIFLKEKSNYLGQRIVRVWGQNVKVGARCGVYVHYIFRMVSVVGLGLVYFILVRGNKDGRFTRFKWHGL